jgi:hypothetical protein
MAKTTQFFPARAKALPPLSLTASTVVMHVCERRRRRGKNASWLKESGLRDGGLLYVGLLL